MVPVVFEERACSVTLGVHAKIATAQEIAPNHRVSLGIRISDTFYELRKGFRLVCTNTKPSFKMG